jgi:hypothetical protein
MTQHHTFFNLPTERKPVAQPVDLRNLFHRLNNQLGIILANAELLQAKAVDDTTRARAGQVVTSVLEAMTTVRDIRASSVVRHPGCPSPPRRPSPARLPLFLFQLFRTIQIGGLQR